MLTLDRETAGPVLKRATALAKRRLRREAGRLHDEKAIAFACRRELGRLQDFLRILPEEDIADALASVQRYVKRCLATFKSPREETTPSLQERMAAEIIPTRTTVGFPHDLHRIPKSERRSLPGETIYGPLANLLAGMDGRKTLRELFNEIGWEQGKPLTAREMRQLLGAVEYLTEYGYLQTHYLRAIDRAEIVSALKQVGIAPGDLVLVHSAMSPLGYIDGGADTVIDALLEVIGKEGTLLMPAFSRTRRQTVVAASNASNSVYTKSSAITLPSFRTTAFVV
jgi:hypothetical protein